jgi:hypothetical protein
MGFTSKENLIIKLHIGLPSTVVEATAGIERKRTNRRSVSEMCFDYGRCDRNLRYAVHKDWTGKGGTKFPLKHKAFAKRLHSGGIGDGWKVGSRSAAPTGRRPASLPSSPLHIVLDG